MWNSRWSQGEQQRESQRGELLLSVRGETGEQSQAQQESHSCFKINWSTCLAYYKGLLKEKWERKCLWIRQGSQIVSVQSFLANTWLPALSINKSIIYTIQHETKWPVRFHLCITLLHSNGKKKKHRHDSIDTLSERENPHILSSENYINYLFI